MSKLLQIGIVVGLLTSCAHHPARVRCQDHLQPINPVASAHGEKPSSAMHAQPSGENP
jgi:hypothetical protein